MIIHKLCLAAVDLSECLCRDVFVVKIFSRRWEIRLDLLLRNTETTDSLLRNIETTDSLLRNTRCCADLLFRSTDLLLRNTTNQSTDVNERESACQFSLRVVRRNK